MTHNVTYGSEVWGFVVSLLITDNLLVLLACNSEVTLQDIYIPFYTQTKLLSFSFNHSFYF